MIEIRHAFILWMFANLSGLAGAALLSFASYTPTPLAIAMYIEAVPFYVVACGFVYDAVQSLLSGWRKMKAQ